MTQEIPAMTAGDAPLDTLLAITEEEVRQAAERLSDGGVLDPVSAHLLATVRMRLLVALDRVRRV
jgi:hypothetical protein